MLQTILISGILLFAGVLLLGFRIFFVKNGSFPNIHIGGNAGLKNKGISCATSQDRDAQKITQQSTITQLMNDITEKF